MFYKCIFFLLALLWKEVGNIYQTTSVTQMSVCLITLRITLGWLVKLNDWLAGWLVGWLVAGTLVCCLVRFLAVWQAPLAVCIIVWLVVLLVC